jgi:glycosyltransferase involved in cell wall biosynthesis
VFHTDVNVGYAIEPIERMFYQAGLELAGGEPRLIHFAFRRLTGSPPRSLPAGFSNVIEFNFRDIRRQNIHALADYVRKNRIYLVVVFDIQPVHPLFRPLRKAGAHTILSYYGAPISSLMPAWKLALKRLQVRLSRSKVDGLIFESKAMAETAVRGRGVPAEMIDIVPLGVDVEKYKPSDHNYVYDTLRLPRDKQIVVYSGHMEPRKGVATLVEAAIELLHLRNRQDVCFVFFGNKGQESAPYERLYEHMPIRNWIRFMGYRNDLHRIFPGCFCGVIPSSGWDSFPRSALEMAACGIPVLASRLGGLPEAVLDGKTGLLFTPRDARELADRLAFLLDHPELAQQYGAQGRKRCENEFSEERWKQRFLKTVQKRL